MPCAPNEHDWQERGRGDHAYERNVILVRCAKCRQDGYRRKVNGVVFTWAKADAE